MFDLDFVCVDGTFINWLNVELKIRSLDSFDPALILETAEVARKQLKLIEHVQDQPCFLPTEDHDLVMDKVKSLIETEAASQSQLLAVLMDLVFIHCNLF